jgi:hypothetical protein
VLQDVTLANPSNMDQHTKFEDPEATVIACSPVPHHKNERTTLHKTTVQNIKKLQDCRYQGNRNTRYKNSSTKESYEGTHSLTHSLTHTHIHPRARAHRCTRAHTNITSTKKDNKAYLTSHRISFESQQPNVTGNGCHQACYVLNNDDKNHNVPI